MVAILKDMGINDFEPRVINQMLEFSYRFAVFWSRHLSFLMILFKICHWHPGRCQGLLQPRQKESSGHRGRETSSPACRGAGRFWKYPDSRSSIYCSRVLHRLHPERLFWSWPGLKTQLSFLWYRCNALQWTVACNPLLAKDSHTSFSSQKLVLGYRLIAIASPPPIINSRPGISRRSGENLISSSNLRHRPSGFDYGGGGGGGLKPQYNRSKPGD